MRFLPGCRLSAILMLVFIALQGMSASAYSCGGKYQKCCRGRKKCHGKSLTCEGKGRGKSCIPCGGQGQTCCRGRTCDSRSLACFTTRGRRKCQKCGGAGQKCCPGKKCLGSLGCLGGKIKKCRPLPNCGGKYQRCCPGKKCGKRNLTCKPSRWNKRRQVCTPKPKKTCGGHQQRCCPGRKCDGDSLECFGRTRKTCQKCGGAWQKCCRGNKCSNDSLGCFGGKNKRCQPCGSEYEQCCPGRGCKSKDLTCRGRGRGTCERKPDPVQCKNAPEMENNDACEDKLGILQDISQTRKTYDPATVNWRSVKKSFEYIANKEKRFCNFAIRAHFHDAGALSDIPSNPKVYGSDGSLLLDKFEFLQPENAYDAFAIFARIVIKEFSSFFGASFADLLNVAAFTCVENLGGIVSIPETCANYELDMFVGKIDSSFTFSKDAARDRVDHLPGPFQETPVWVNFWINVLNEAVDAEKWKFTVEEGLALMGSHTLIDNQACTTSGPQVPSADTPESSLRDEGCSGKQRVFEWSNSYFVDAKSGQCSPRKPNPGEAEWFPTSMDNSKGRQPNEEEDAQLEACPWSSEDGRQMGKNLQCVVKKGAEQFDIGQIPEDNDFRFVDWFPDESRAPCCGFHCQTCPGGLGDDAVPYFCANDSPEGTSFWFYTWQDCDMIYATRNPDSYCALDRTDCTAVSEDKLKTELAKMSYAYTKYASDTKEWQKYYAFGHCKLNNLAATYSNHKIELLPELEKCKGGYSKGVCTSDPDPMNGVVKLAHWGNSCPKEMKLSGIISKSQCSDCLEDVEEMDDIVVPEHGKLVPGETVDVSNGEEEVTVRVAELSGE